MIFIYFGALKNTLSRKRPLYRLVGLIITFIMLPCPIGLAAPLPENAWIDCNTTITLHTAGHTQQKQLHFAFDVAKIDDDIWVKIFDLKQAESIGIYPAELNCDDLNCTLMFKMVDLNEDTWQFKLVYPQVGGPAEFYTQLEDAAWINMLNDVIITKTYQRDHQGECQATVDYVSYFTLAAH